MSWNWKKAKPCVVLGALAAFTVGAALADDEGEKKAEKSPLAKIMVTIDKGTKTIRDATKSRANFKKANNGKDVATIAADLAKFAPKLREFKEPAAKMKKPFDKWTEMSDIYKTSMEDLAKAAEKGDFIASQKAWTPVYNTCTNCHGTFRPESGDDF